MRCPSSHCTSADPIATIQLGQTVYGGTLDVVNGTMTVDRAKRTFVGDASENWRYENAAAGPNFYIYVPDATAPQFGLGSILCNQALPSPINGSRKDRAFISGGRNFNVTLGETLGLSNVSDWKSYLSEHPIEVEYALATPFEVTLTPTQITMLAGTNNVWSNAGNITLKYLIDSELIPFDLENETGFTDAIGSIIGVDDIIVIGDYGLCLNNFTVSGNICTSAAGTVSGNTLIAV